MKKAALHNLGCKVNAYETEAMQQMLEQSGYEIVGFTDKADVYIINTCTVTNIADRKSRQMLHKAKKMNPEAIVVATGCYAQASKEQIELDDCVDIIVGNNKKKDIIRILNEYESEQELSHVIDINHTTEYEELELESSLEHTRAIIKVQDGCNQFCSYCIIPYARGRVRSRKITQVISEVEKLSAKGFKEVVLTGIHLSSYGVDLEEEDLLSLVVAVSKVQGIERIRLGSLEPRIITEEFASTLSNLKNMCPHFHLSLQSGCDKTLKRMNRRYSAQEYYEKCMLLRKYFNNPAITTDVIVGFPGETEEEFNITKEYVEKVNFFEMHVFKYSKRQGTKAAEMEEQVEEHIKNNRSATLLAITKKQSEDYLNSQIGKELEVLIEEETQIDGVKYFVGHSKEYVKTLINSEENLENKIISCIGTKRYGQNMILAEMKR
ncbi:tRNA (N(6)-L-threonylcarbamoyladenosine(37)-C(2))-methylthiotransferase MtaB [Candidatus Galacturonibacter soehngenii]|uniref:Threonylcarbamoyladenosine tRNA methylthiotransferase MtaB n=1 Tax=Candidatus Galacturonatibacter soehngenii TaxID=2307010 RepID=A0A7V7QJE7_9FIRM|nr:tRNA (N(6)-L-threonylcarbamoyladenosine(37)-C(2))-methylthiotransferase MtaB [Candidatus Galacturonibacter soehngenii]KAB1437729.1 tRNA (N(6)-L-threonylcarbamoyladenosine(37)-C(2))-methylthiotransferase MtaB [Candidatus Galacturonibacter soehngenii]MBA4686961.1 tRNA (N(6)-L-threonylcarbamoyladenosine(37)-C(2))-methylthiotransferase MtaB [Candidatus Galacturonibacter soehngenii]